MFYRDPDLRLFLGHMCDIRIYQWTRARVAYKAGRVLLFPLAVLFDGHFKLRDKIFSDGPRQTRVVARPVYAWARRRIHKLGIFFLSVKVAGKSKTSSTVAVVQSSCDPAQMTRTRQTRRLTYFSVLARGTLPSPPIRCVAVPGASGHSRRLATAVGTARPVKPEPVARRISNINHIAQSSLRGMRSKMRTAPSPGSSRTLRGRQRPGRASSGRSDVSSSAITANIVCMCPKPCRPNSDRHAHALARNPLYRTER